MTERFESGDGRVRNMHKRSADPHLYDCITNTLSSGYVLTVDDLKQVFIEFGYSPKSVSNFDEQISRGRIRYFNGIEIASIKIKGKRIYSDSSLKPEDTDINDVTKMVLSTRREKGRI